MTELHGGSPWGASTFAGPDGSRQPSKLEMNIAKKQGKVTWGQLDMCSRKGRNHEEPKRTAGSSECEHSWLSCQYLLVSEDIDIDTDIDTDIDIDIGIDIDIDKSWKIRRSPKLANMEPPLQQASHTPQFAVQWMGDPYFMIFHTSLVGLLGGLDSKDRSLLQRSSKCASEA